MLQVGEGLDIEPLRISVVDQPAYCMLIESEFDGEPWYHDIKNYLLKGEFPPESSIEDRKYIAKMATKFFLSGQTLYKRSFDSVLLRCVDAKEANMLMKGYVVPT